jgi:simple sugar transport system permease protein
MSLDLAGALATSAVTMAIPLLFAALGELISERAGIINIGLEGFLLAGAFVAFGVTYATGSPTAGIALAIACGALLGLGFAFFAVLRNANQVVVGTALNLFAVGTTGVVYRAAFGSTGQALSIDGSPHLAVPVLDTVPVVGAAFFRQTALGYLCILSVPLVAFALLRTVAGLRLRMAGENPRAAETQGVSVAAQRSAALVFCGALAAAGGAYLAVDYSRTFIEGMSAGRGFIALAIVIVGRRDAWGIFAASLFFGFTTALQFHFQALGLAIPYQFFLLLPYVVTLALLSGLSGAAKAPAALGQPYDRTS